MKVNMVVNLTHFKLEPNSETEAFELIFTDNHERIKDIYTPEVIKRIGENALADLENDAFVFYHKTIKWKGLSTQPTLIAERDKIVSTNVSNLSDLLTFLWIIRDHSVCIVDATCTVSLFKLLRTVIVHWICFNSKGKLEPVTFSKENIVTASELLLKYRALSKKMENSEKNVHVYLDSPSLGIVRNLESALSVDFDYNETNCIERAIHFLETARKQEALIYRIAFYMSAFECLFTTNSNEVGSKLRYRIAFYLGRDRDELLDIDNIIRDAYGIRSTFIHGQIWTDKKKQRTVTREKLENISVKVDDLLRRALFKILTEDAEYFIKTDNSTKEADFHKWAYGGRIPGGLPVDTVLISD